MYKLNKVNQVFHYLWTSSDADVEYQYSQARAAHDYPSMNLAYQEAKRRGKVRMDSNGDIVIV